MNIARVLIAALIAGLLSFSPAVEAKAAKKKMTLNTARKMAILNSDSVENAEMKVESKQAAYESAVKSLKIKEQSMRQFRWSPLLSFHFPETPNFAQASEFQYKPVQLQYDIRVAQHNLQDKNFEVSEKVNNLFVDIVALQENIAFNEKRLETAQTGLKKNQAKLKLGQANKSDVEKIEKNIESLTSKISSQRTTLSSNLTKLSKMIGVDVTTGYDFEKPFVDADIERSQLPAIIKYTEDRDEGYYEACIEEVTARAELNTNAGLMRNKYGGDYFMISSYVQTALNGQAVNKKAFKASYKQFLVKIDSYWGGKKRIFLFIKIPRLWFKGNMDGTRYIDDDPYALYQNVLDYNSACNDKKAAKDELDQLVTDTYNNYVSVKNAYKQYVKDVDNASKDLKKAEYLNRVGQLTFEEYQSQLDSYEEMQNSMLDAMKLYATTLYSFDRLTCGGISALMKGTDADLQTAVVGESYVEKEVSEGAYYTLRPIIQEQEFELSLRIPDDFEISITHYELWVDNIQVGGRTPVDKKLRHLMITADGVDEAKIRLLDNGKFVDDCKIDPSEESGRLEITKGFVVKKEEIPELGTFTVDANETTGIVELKFEMKNEKIRKFKVLTQDGKPLGGDVQIDIDKPLKYISVLTQSLSELKVEFYGEDGNLIVRGRLDDANGIVRREE
ncbi:TolC family protein [Butyrivibrio sp. DSM 10294]|uniref:TolC family protein n=1 Tax=Butyrivibrio sp. DSM 10294 TaxID=2972457 RepID=UPI00234E4849|nr:TolC family protein [Butyrivibrio sp. DSM 10294]MDC7293999.1 TolC family protein [Butyrivibrio sp. DSM 10294]